MRCRIALDIRDVYLKRKVELIASPRAIFTDKESAEVVFTDDKDSATQTAIRIGRGEGYEIKIPFSDETLLSYLPKGEERLTLSLVGDKVFLGEREIRLTELERGLFERLYRAKGEFVSREILAEVFSGAESASILNVYIHYLREKLERDGMRVIFSSRKSGYKIDEKFFAREAENA